MKKANSAAVAVASAIAVGTTAKVTSGMVIDDVTLARLTAGVNHIQLRGEIS